MTIRTILVDDEPLAIQGLRLRLEKHDDVEIVETCSNGREAIRAIKTHKPDLVFLDIQMPGFDGFSVIQVNDTGPGSEDIWVKAQQSTGVGLANIRDRLSQAYGADHRFETESNKQGGFGVTIEIPYQSEPAEEPK